MQIYNGTRYLNEVEELLKCVVLLMGAHAHTWFALMSTYIGTYIASNTVCPHVARLSIQL